MLDLSLYVTLPFESVFSNTLLVILVPSLLAIFTAAIFRLVIGMQETGTEKMQNIALQIKRGAMAFLRREYSVIFLFAVVVSALIYVFLDTGFDDLKIGAWGKPYSAISFALGAFCSVLSGFAGMRTAVAANVRTTQAARTGLRKALRIAFLSGATVGLSVVGLGLMGLVLAILYMIEVGGESMQFAVGTVAAFSFGASSVALFARVGGGIYTKAADVGADLVGKVE